MQFFNQRERTCKTCLKPVIVEDGFLYNMGSLLPSFGWGGWETASLPREKEPGETPQGVKRPRRLAGSPQESE